MNLLHQVLYLSHGGGPLPLLGDASHEEMVHRLREIAADIGRPSAIVVISAHWEEDIPTIISSRNPPLIYDYHGFPEASYAYRYPCPGEPLLAERIGSCFAESGIDARLTDNRGFDHGLFVPLKIMFPDAGIPCLQISLVNSLDPVEHVKIGQALRELDYDRPVLFIGSGFSFHNMRAFFAEETEESREKNHAFEAWLLETCCSRSLSEEDRQRRLENWEAAPNARYCHPREEHLLPLQVCYGIAGGACSEPFELQILNKKASMYLWRSGSQERRRPDA